MVSPKQNNLAAVVVKRNSSQNTLQNSSYVTVNSDLAEEDSWVVIKKQRVNILIPRLPDIEQSIVPDLEQGQLQGDMASDLNNDTPVVQDEKHLEVYSSEKNDGSISLAMAANIESPREVSPKDNAIAMEKPRKLDSRKPSNEDQVGSSRVVHRKKRTVRKTRKAFAGCKTFSAFDQSGLSGVAVKLPSATVNLCKMMRALNLERKIVKAGGLNRWLYSLGLEQFLSIFQEKNMNKFQLANLTMQKLKDMGAHAVGPRRKLIHAIECITQPYCFEGL